MHSGRRRPAVRPAVSLDVPRDGSSTACTSAREGTPATPPAGPPGRDRRAAGARPRRRACTGTAAPQASDSAATHSPFFNGERRIPGSALGPATATGRAGGELLAVSSTRGLRGTRPTPSLTHHLRPLMPAASHVAHMAAAEYTPSRSAETT